MEEKITLDLTKDSVSVKKQKYVTTDGIAYQIGELNTEGFSNSLQGRKNVQVNVEEPYLSAILAMWGDNPTVVIPE